MDYNLSMSLSDLVAELLRGEADKLQEKDLYTYMENLIHGNRQKLQQVKKEVVRITEEEYVFSVYAEQYFRYKRGIIKPSLRDLDDLYFEEEALRKEGKTILSVNFLYQAIMRGATICEAHQDVVESAYWDCDIDYLYIQWKELILEPQIRLLQAVCNNMQKNIPIKSNNRVQVPNSPKKRLNEYPEVFGIDKCCEITGYKKSTIYKLTAKNEIPYFRPGCNGRKLMFRQEEILEWMTARRQETTEEFINGRR